MLQVGFLPTLPSLLKAPNTPLIHRDLSWLQFNERVLAEARQATNPVLERIKFLAISSSNLDEFFMIRLAALGRSIGTVGKTDPAAARRLMQIRASILETVGKFVVRQSEALDVLSSELEAAGVFMVRTPKEGEQAYALGKRIFEEQIFPQLTAPEPFSVGKIGSLQNLQIAAVFQSQGPNRGNDRSNDVWFKIPRSLPSVYWMIEKSADGEQIFFFFLDDLLAMHLGTAFKLADPTLNPGFLRLTRDGDFTVDLEEEDTESIPEVVRTGLGSREKGRPVRLQYSGNFSEEFLSQCLRALRMVAGQVLYAPGTMNFHGLWSLFIQTPEALVAKSSMKYPPFASIMPKPFHTPKKLFEHLKQSDILLHHPYDSFDAFVAWIQAACADPDVTQVEVTIYRMDALSPIVDAMKGAAATKKVRAIIELRARFDELNNLRLAEELRKAGVEVAFGFGKLKLHAKIALITRIENGETKLYTHLSTGNYNAATARQYTDLAILTANPEIGQDARGFIDAVFKGQIPTSFKQLVSAPTRMHRKLLMHIQAETEAAQKGEKARIVAKVNALVDEGVIDHLYMASNAGVQVDLIVRGACSLIPGIKGLSENIRVISVVDRFLEHSRIYYFGHSNAMYLSSADWMPRNFFSRLEIAFPVLNANLYRYLEEIVIPAYLADTVKARELTPLGTWKKRSTASAKAQVTPPLKAIFKNQPPRSQFLFEELAKQEYRGTSLEKTTGPAGDPE
ncbi:MAG: polyphosphate kinase 1 [Methylotenera sp.]|nr:polyphosphate kinase 1 [Oligoflexia bacterium]